MYFFYWRCCCCQLTNTHTHILSLCLSATLLSSPFFAFDIKTLSHILSASIEIQILSHPLVLISKVSSIWNYTWFLIWAFDMVAAAESSPCVNSSSCRFNGYCQSLFNNANTWRDLIKLFEANLQTFLLDTTFQNHLGFFHFFILVNFTKCRVNKFTFKSFVGVAPGANVVEHFTVVIYHHSVAIPPFYVVKLHYLGNFHGMLY